MKFFLLSVVCLLGTTLASEKKLKRDVLPGDPRYGTNYNHQVEVSKSVGSYAGSYSVPDNTYQTNFQAAAVRYGPPNHQPSQPLGSNYLAPVQQVRTTYTPASVYGPPQPAKQTVQHVQHTTHQVQPVRNSYLAPSVEHVSHSVAPSTSYGIPVTSLQQTAHHVQHTTHQVQPVRNSYLAPTVEHVSHSVAPSTSYGAPVTSVKQTAHHVQHTTHQVQPVRNSYLAPSVEDVRHSVAPSTSYGTPVTSVKETTHTLNNDYLAPASQSVRQFVEPLTNTYGVPQVKQSHAQTYHAPVIPQTSGSLVQEHVHLEHTKTFEKPQLQGFHQQVNQVRQPSVSHLSTSTHTSGSNYHQLPQTYHQLPSATPAQVYSHSRPSVEYGAPVRTVQHQHQHQVVHQAPQEHYQVEVTRNVPHSAPLPQVHHVQQPVHVSVAQSIPVAVPQQTQVHHITPNVRYGVPSGPAVDSESVSVEAVNTKKYTQPIGENGGYVY